MEIENDRDGRVWLDMTNGEVWHDWGDFYWDGIRKLWEETTRFPKYIKELKWQSITKVG